MDQLAQIIEVPRDFLKDGIQFIRRCKKPDKREFIQTFKAVGIGFILLGFIGYIIKIIHIPINRILVGGA